MRYSRLLATGLFLISASTTALAAATADEAARIRTAIQVYAGAEPGVVDVKPSGDDYIITLDPAPYLAKVKAPNFSAKIDAVVLTARPKGDGQWDVSQTGPYNFNVAFDGQNSIDGKIAANEWKGVFDEGVASFLTSDFSLKNIVITQILSESGMKTTSVSTIESWSGSSTGKPRADGAIDATGTNTLGPTTVVSTMEPPPGTAPGSMPPLDYTATAAGGDTTSTVTGFRSKAILDLVAWFVARPSQELIVRDQAQLKEKIAAALPLWEELDSNGAYKTVNIKTALGDFSMATVGGGVAMSGVTEAGKLREAINFSGLTIPPGLVPPWSSDLVPHTFKLDFTVSGVNMKAPVDVMLAEADFAKDPPLSPESQLKLLPAFAPNGTMNVNFTGGEITSATNSISYDGDLLVNFTGIPTGKFNIRMKGMEETIAKVQVGATAADQMAQQAMGTLVAAKGLAKTEADGSLLWVVEILPDSKILINGVDPMSMMGGAPQQ
ncbi:MAG: hypothetical protein LCH46_14740 [Proteobacteria bacterium]|nr:hypothetical protein [Pseudomonadota bacterium]